MASRASYGLAAMRPSRAPRQRSVRFARPEKIRASHAACAAASTAQGVVRVGGDADLLVLSSDDLELRYVVAKGELVRTPEWTRGGFFEEGGRIRPYVPPED